MIDFSDPNYWYNRDKYIILGFSRSGQTALSRYLHCGFTEIAPNGPAEYLEKYPQCQPVIITRNPVDRIWSAYNYHLYFRDMAFEDFLNFKSPRWNNISCNDVIAMSDYEKYIEPFRKYNVKVYRLEDMHGKEEYIKKGFADPRTFTIKPIPDKYRKMINDRLDKAGISY